jgi:thymidylate synthase
MNNIDKQYQDLLQSILDYGVVKKDRTGTGTKSIFGYTIRHSMKDGFPLLTTKKMAWKQIVTELIWFLRGDTNIKFLVDNDCHIWDGDAYKNYEKAYEKDNSVGLSLLVARMDGKSTYRKPTKEQFIAMIQADDEFAKKWGELGPVYGKQWRSWETYDFSIDNDFGNNEFGGGWNVKPIDQIQNLINDLKTNPDSRRLMVNAWNVGELDQMVLPPCHYGFQVYTRELSKGERIELLNKAGGGRRQTLGVNSRVYNPEFEMYNIPTRAISLMWNQRSVDTFLGLPFNIASYGLLLEIIAKAVNMVPDQLIGNLGDTHLYLNHLNQAQEQIGRELTDEERYNIWFTNNYETGMERYFDPNNLPDFDNEYYTPTPKRTREPFELPKLVINKTTSFWDSFDVSLFGHLDSNDFTLENYQSHPTIKAPLSN